jgi:predicted NUDIX family phosphoesterase
MSKDEKVLCVKADLLESIGGFRGFQPEVGRYLPSLLDRHNQTFLARSICETDPSFKQLIPYVVLFHQPSTDSEPSIFQYTRGSGQGEARLHALRSVGIGGHISTDDTYGEDWYGNGMKRELEEEIILEQDYQATIVGLIYDDRNEVGKVHLGVVHVVRLDGPHARARESDLLESGFVGLSAIRRDRDRLETWSQLCIDHLFPA